MAKSKSYDSRVIESAGSVGYKAANLIFLQEILQEFSSKSRDSGVKIQVPEFISIPHDTIKEYLDGNASGWQALWGEFKESFSRQTDQKILGDGSRSKLEALQNLIRESFEKKPLSIDSKSLESGTLMVRSTGKEDSVEMANPGGNESLPSLNESSAVSHAISEVVASYFGEKSFAQRLFAGDDVTRDPFMPVLIQSMVGESEADMVYSGVVYTGENGTTRIQAAPGHGELIVNSKGNFDNYYVSQEKMVYGEVSDKSFRIKSEFDNASGRLSLKEIDNSASIRSTSSLTPEVVRSMHDAALFIEEKYGMRMDIEFVYNSSSNTINIVQARSLPEGNAAGIQPVALSPEYLNTIGSDGGVQLKGKTVTPDLKAAVLISKAEEIFVANTIEEALSKYLKEGKIKAVIIKNKAPDTSHEAGEFKSKNIPVIQIENLSSAERMVEDLKSGKQILVDPQRSSMFELPLKFQGKNLEELKADGVVKDGLFSSGLSGNVSIEQYKFTETDEKVLPGGEARIDEKLGDLVAKAGSGDAESTNKLFVFLFKKIYEQGSPASKTSSDFLSNLEKLSNPINQGQHEKMVKSILKNIYHFRKNDLITQDVFIQMVLTGAELLLALDMINSSKNLESSTANYLDIFKKFEGIIISEGEKDVNSKSVFQELARAYHAKEMGKLLQEKGVELHGEYLEVFIDATRLKKYFISEEKGNKYVEFCLEQCETKEGAKALGGLIYNVARLGIAAQWCNIAFGTKDVEALSREMELLKEDKNIAIIDKTISKFEAQVVAWKDPTKFTKLLEEFTKNLSEISVILKHDKTKSEVRQLIRFKQMHDLVDALDLSIKSMEKSSEYSDKTQQAKNFQAMLLPFFDLMKIWTHDAGFANPQLVNQGFSRLIHPGAIGSENYLDAIETALKDFRNINSHDLSPSGKFDVSSATIDRHMDNAGWGRTFKNIDTLEDIFTLIHQNLIVSMIKQSFALSHKLKDEMPDFYKTIANQLKTFPNINDNYGASSDLVSVEFSRNELISHYNIPLRNHSARMDIKYDQNTKETSLVFLAFGERPARWKAAEEIGKMEINLKIAEKQIIQDVVFEEAKSTLKFEVIIKDQSDLNSVVYAINKILKQSFMDQFFSMEYSRYKDVGIDKIISFLQKYKSKEEVEKIQKMLHSSMEISTKFNINAFGAQIDDIETAKKICEFFFKNNNYSSQIPQNTILAILKMGSYSFAQLQKNGLSSTLLQSLDQTKFNILFSDQGLKFLLTYSEKADILKLVNNIDARFLEKIVQMHGVDFISDYYSKDFYETFCVGISADRFSEKCIEEILKIHPKIFLKLKEAGVTKDFMKIETMNMLLSEKGISVLKDFARIPNIKFHYTGQIIDNLDNEVLEKIVKYYQGGMKDLFEMFFKNTDSNILTDERVEAILSITNFEDLKDVGVTKDFILNLEIKELKNFLSENGMKLLKIIVDAIDDIGNENSFGGDSALEVYKTFARDVALDQLTLSARKAIRENSEFWASKYYEKGLNSKLVSKLTSKNIEYVFRHQKFMDNIGDLKKLIELEDGLLNKIIKYCNDYHHGIFPQFEGEITESSFQEYVDTCHKPSIDACLFPDLLLRNKSYKEIGAEKQKALHDYQESHKELESYDGFKSLCDEAGISDIQKLWQEASSTGSIHEVTEDLLLKYMGDNHGSLPLVK